MRWFEKAAFLGFAIIKGHPLLDGNKRLGIITTLVFLLLNGYTIKTKRKEVLNIAINIALNKISQKDFMLWLKKRTRKIKPTLVNGFRKFFNGKKFS